MSGADELGAAIVRLAQTIEARKGAPADASYTASLLAAGPIKCAKKLGEEAIELALAAAQESGERVAAEAGDVLYHLLVLLAARGVSPAEVAAALKAREGQSGHAEKASRKP
jgi:phosphoribosyl-ATP pyrophosphohydrolase